MIQLTEFGSPLGKIAVAERKGKVLAVGFGGRRSLRLEHPEIWELGEIDEVAEGESAMALRSYLGGRVARLDVSCDLSLVPSAFDRSVLLRLCKVRAGQTVSYGELATSVGSPGAARAVGGAMRRNPIPIVVPCHRVLPQTGRLGNYTGGVSKKSWLLAREGVRLQR